MSQTHGRSRFPRAYVGPHTAEGIGICWCPFGCDQICGDQRRPLKGEGGTVAGDD